MQNGDLSNLRRASAGFAAGITEALVVVTPFEVVKIKLQQQKGTSKEFLRYRVSPLVIFLTALTGPSRKDYTWNDRICSALTQLLIMKHSRYRHTLSFTVGSARTCNATSHGGAKLHLNCTFSSSALTPSVWPVLAALQMCPHPKHCS